jgi:ribokinase
MTNRTDMVSPDALVLTHALEKLRARDGLTHSRLENSRSVEAAPLLNLAAVRRHADVHNVELAQAALDVIAECVRESLQGLQRPVADAVLGLGIFSEAYIDHGVDKRVVSALHSDLLGRRRSVLLSNWRLLHEALDLTPGEPPSDRALRGNIERDVLRELARQLTREGYSFGSRSAITPYASENSSRRTPMQRPGRVIVIGGTVMDATFHAKEVPPRGTSTEAYAFGRAPGGKGLWQAVAAARLGLDVILVAAVADDQFGREIVDFLNDERVDTSQLKRVRDAQTPFTGVIEFEMGDSIAINWPNRSEVHLDISDIERLGQHFTACDAVLLTFEIPRETLQYTLALVNRLDERPVAIVTPGQPYTDAGISGQALSQIDYLVAQPWELGRYLPPDRQSFDIDATAQQLLTYGVKTLCILAPGGGCNIYSETPLGTFTVPTFPGPYLEWSTSRDAYCAALAAKLIDSRGSFSEEVALWATAAMSAAIADHPLPNPMPDRRRVEQLIERSRFNVNSRRPQLSDADDASPEPGQPSFSH